MTYRTPGTWYRAVFLSNTIVLLIGTYVVLRFAGGKLQIAALAILMPLLLPGVSATRRLWDERFRRSEAEGRFYLANADKLVYSEEDAAWFLAGLDRLYAVGHSHYISKVEPEGPRPKQLLKEFDAVWRFQDGAWIADPQLYKELSRRNQ